MINKLIRHTKMGKKVLRSVRRWAGKLVSGLMAVLAIVGGRYFDKVLARGDWDQAGAYLSRIRGLRPNSPFLAEGERRLAEAKAEAEVDAGCTVFIAPKAEALVGEMVKIPGGSFRMGDLSGEGHHNGERPVHVVTVSPFRMGKYEVTFLQWDACVADGGCSYRPGDKGWGRGRRPVIHVSWDDIQEFIAWLNHKTGGGYRLPTESEWEYAARARSGSKYSWGDRIGDNRANCKSCGSRWDGKRTAPVGSFRANAWGLHDMHGNVWEWVEDCWNDSYRGAPDDGSAWLNGDCSRRVMRGGSWFNNSWSMRSSNRGRFFRSYRSNNLGFRLARDR